MNNLRDSENTGETSLQKFVKYFTLFMTLVYPALGIYLLVAKQGQLPLSATTKMILGIMLIVYGLYRFYRTYREHFGKSKEEID